jgi:hypothetical protein
MLNKPERKTPVLAEHGRTIMKCQNMFLLRVIDRRAEWGQTRGKIGSFHETAKVVNSLQVPTAGMAMQAEFALVPLTISDTSREEAL